MKRILMTGATGQAYTLTSQTPLLHMQPRFTGTRPATRAVADLTGRSPIESAQFVAARGDELVMPLARR